MKLVTAHRCARRIGTFRSTITAALLISSAQAGEGDAIHFATPVPIAFGAGSAAPGRASGPQGDSWESIAKLPDFTTGIWLGKMSIGTGPAGPPGGSEPPLARDGRNCTPNSMPGIMGGPLGLEFLFTPRRVTIATEADRAIRRIYIQPKHSTDPDYTFMGESIAHWEGDTLVVDTIAIKAAYDKPPSRVLERIRLTGPNTLQIEQTIYNDGHASRHTRLYERRAKERIMEYYCEENPRDRFDAAGNATVDTTQK